MKRATRLSCARTPKCNAKNNNSALAQLIHRLNAAYCAAHPPAVSCPTMNLRLSIIAQSFIPLCKAHLLA